MSVKYEIRQEIEKIKWLCRNNLIKCEDKMNPIYDAIMKIQDLNDK